MCGFAFGTVIGGAAQRAGKDITGAFPTTGIAAGSEFQRGINVAFPNAGIPLSTTASGPLNPNSIPRVDEKVDTTLTTTSKQNKRNVVSSGTSVQIGGRLLTPTSTTKKSLLGT